MHIDDNVRMGMSPQEARRQALIKLGGLMQTKEDWRGQRGLPVLEDLWHDLRYGARGLLRHRTFTLIAVLTLALGIGANTAIFSVINAVLLRPLPFPDPDRVLILYETFKPHGVTAISVPNLRDWQQQNTVFDGIAAYEAGDFNLESGDGAERLRGMRVEANYFDVLGIKPQLGRAFLKGEDKAGSEAVIILSDALWRDHFGADPGIINKTIPLNGHKYTVVGVMPPALSAVFRAQVWAPLLFPEGEETARGSHDYFALGRLKQGVTAEQAREQMAIVAARLEQQYPDVQRGVGSCDRLAWAGHAEQAGLRFPSTFERNQAGSAGARLHLAAFAADRRRLRLGSGDAVAQDRCTGSAEGRRQGLCAGLRRQLDAQRFGHHGACRSLCPARRRGPSSQEFL
jgi:putative ABC transport system permease protein